MSANQKIALQDKILAKVARQYVSNTLLPELRGSTTLTSYVTHQELRHKNFVDFPQLEGRDVWVRGDQRLGASVRVNPSEFPLIPKLAESSGIMARG